MKKHARQNASLLSRLKRRLKITHPFHPLFNQEFDLILYKKNWGREVVDCRGKDNQLITIPIAWTNLADPDPYIAISKGRSYFRTDDLVRLVNFLEGKKS